jgi:hypothetical protein
MSVSEASGEVRCLTSIDIDMFCAAEKQAMKLLVTSPSMANSVKRFLDRMITDTAPPPYATT